LIHIWFATFYRIRVLRDSFLAAFVQAEGRNSVLHWGPDEGGKLEGKKLLPYAKPPIRGAELRTLTVKQRQGGSRLPKIGGPSFTGIVRRGGAGKRRSLTRFLAETGLTRSMDRYSRRCVESPKEE